MQNEVHAELRLEWGRRGHITLDASDRLRFPHGGFQPGVYRFSVVRADDSKANYIGESDNIHRRFAHYRNPGPGQATNLRINHLFKQWLSAGAEIQIDLVVSAWIIRGNIEERADFYSKSQRRMFEGLALAVGWSEEIESLNK